MGFVRQLRRTYRNDVIHLCIDNTLTRRVDIVFKKFSSFRYRTRSNMDDGKNNRQDDVSCIIHPLTICKRLDFTLRDGWFILLRKFVLGDPSNKI